MSRRVWKKVEDKANKARIAKTEIKKRKENIEKKKKSLEKLEQWKKYVVATTSLRITNKLLSKLKSIISHGNHKRTWQKVPNILLHYLYNTYIVHANDK